MRSSSTGAWSWATRARTGAAGSEPCVLPALLAAGRARGAGERGRRRLLRGYATGRGRSRGGRPAQRHREHREHRQQHRGEAAARGTGAGHARNGTGCSPGDTEMRSPLVPAGEILDQVCLLPSPISRRCSTGPRCATPTGSAAVSKAPAASVSPRPGRPCSTRSPPRPRSPPSASPRRRARVPEVTLPRAAARSARRRTTILEAIRDHQVVIVAGETGSGKTTQIPKICLELGRGVRGMIGHTQPRRIAARTVAERDRGGAGHPAGRGGRLEGPVHRPGEPGRDLREADDGRHPARRDPDGPRAARLRHDHHRRGPRAVPQHRLPARLSRPAAAQAPRPQGRHHLGDHRPGAVLPALRRRPDRARSAARTYPVEVRYRPLLEEDGEDSDRDQITAICDAVDELQSEGPGDILVFLSGEREIRDTADALEKKNLRSTEVLPLYARLSHAEQHRVFQQHSGRRIVLATNVAETSLTVPGIKYVIDPGTARISRYSHRTKVQRLPIEPVSQASANQRKGRCGRTSDGICIRLYSEDDFVSPPGVHRRRDPAYEPGLRHPPDDRGRPRRHREVPLHRPAGPPQHPRRRPTAPGTGRVGPDGEGSEEAAHRRQGRKLDASSPWTRAWPAWSWRPTATAAYARSWSSPPRSPSRTRASARPRSRRRPTSSTPASRTRRSDFLAFLNLWRYVREQQKERGRPPPSAGCASRST